jgi:phosphoserine aminotransferase
MENFIQWRIEYGQLTIMVEISFNQTNLFNRFFNKSDFVTFKRNRFRTSLERSVHNCPLSIVNSQLHKYKLKQFVNTILRVYRLNLRTVHL